MGGRSFGVLCWEVFAVGATPYTDMSVDEVMLAVPRGHRMQRPALCPMDMYDVLMRCWQLEGVARPDFARVRQDIEEAVDGVTESRL